MKLGVGGGGAVGFRPAESHSGQEARHGSGSAGGHGNLRQGPPPGPRLVRRRTFASIGRPLPGRTNIVVTRDPELRGAGVSVARNLEAALAMARPLVEVMVIGGAAIYAGALPLCERIYLTEIHAEIGGDTWFVGYDAGEWRERDRIDHPPDPANRYPYSFMVLERAGRGLGCDGGGVTRNSGARSATDRT